MSSLSHRSRRDNVLRLVTMALFAALSVAAVYLLHFPLFPAAPFLEYDPADIPIFIGTFLFGPWEGLILTVITAIIQGLTVSASSGWIGILMHICATGSFVLVAGFLCRRNKTLPRVILGLACGALTMTAVMVLWNLLMTPLFMGTPVDAVVDLLLPVIIPFNFIKSGVNAVLAGCLYKVLAQIPVFRNELPIDKPLKQ